MYKHENKAQQSFEDFYLPFGGHLDGNNRWVKYRDVINWDLVEEKYSSSLAGTGMGARAIPAQVAVGSLIIKTLMKFTDEETVQSITENPYMQFFLGYEGYKSKPPFDASMLTIFRQRVSAEMVDELTKELIKKELKKKLKMKT